MRVHPADESLYERAGRNAAVAAKAAAMAAARIDEARNPRHAAQVPRLPRQRLAGVRQWLATAAVEQPRDDNLAALLWRLDHPHTDPDHFHRLPEWLRHPMSVRAARIAAALTEDGWTRPDAEEAQR